MQYLFFITVSVLTQTMHAVLSIVGTSYLILSQIIAGADQNNF